MQVGVITRSGEVYGVYFNDSDAIAKLEFNRHWFPSSQWELSFHDLVK